MGTRILYSGNELLKTVGMSVFLNTFYHGGNTHFSELFNKPRLGPGLHFLHKITDLMKRTFGSGIDFIIYLYSLFQELKRLQTPFTFR